MRRIAIVGGALLALPVFWAVMLTLDATAEKTTATRRLVAPLPGHPMLVADIKVERHGVTSAATLRCDSRNEASGYLLDRPHARFQACVAAVIDDVADDLYWGVTQSRCSNPTPDDVQVTVLGKFGGRPFEARLRRSRTCDDFWQRLSPLIEPHGPSFGENEKNRDAYFKECKRREVCS